MLHVINNGRVPLHHKRWHIPVYSRTCIHTGGYSIYLHQYHRRTSRLSVPVWHLNALHTTDIFNIIEIDIDEKAPTAKTLMYIHVNWNVITLKIISPCSVRVNGSPVIKYIITYFISGWKTTLINVNINSVSYLSVFTLGYHGPLTIRFANGLGECPYNVHWLMLWQV